MGQSTTRDLISNRQARFHYEIIETFEAGMVLQGTEIKSIREGNGSLQESYVRIDSGQMWLVGAYIAPYKQGNVHNHEERRPRKLLMHKREIFRLKAKIQEKGLTLIPLGIYLKSGKAKLALALGKGKKAYDKRETIKARDEKRQMQKIMKEIS